MHVSHRFRKLAAAGGIFALSFALLLSCTACTPTVKVKATDFMQGITAKGSQPRTIDDRFLKNAFDFSVHLFQETADDEKNTLLSPLSVMLTLSMTANGAAEDTLIEIQNTLHKEIPLCEWNEYLFSYIKALPNTDKVKINIANSLWFRHNPKGQSRFTIHPDFLQVNANYYNASIYGSPFNNQTIHDMNAWVKAKTDGGIDSIIKEIDEDAVMYLMNAILLDAEWERSYEKKNVTKDTFTTRNGTEQKVDFMRSSETIFLQDSQSVGFAKPYVGNTLQFVALLPNEEISVEKYCENLSGEHFQNLMKSAQSKDISAFIPKFEIACTTDLREPMESMGIHHAFEDSSADFSRMGKSSDGNIFIDEALHKAFINVDARGTKAGAVTKFEFGAKSANPKQIQTIKLDRPFVFAIVDTTTFLPLFMGTVMSLSQK